MKLYYDRADRPMEDPLEDVDDEHLALEDLPPDSLADSVEGSVSADENEADTPPQTLHQNRGNHLNLRRRRNKRENMAHLSLIMKPFFVLKTFWVHTFEIVQVNTW